MEWGLSLPDSGHTGLRQFGLEIDGAWQILVEHMDNFSDALFLEMSITSAIVLHSRSGACAIFVADVGVLGHAAVFCHDDAAVYELPTGIDAI